MSKFLWKSLLVAPAVFGASLVSAAAIAQTAPESNSEMATLDQIMEYSNEGRGAGSLAQVTSVTQFSDVSPGEWAYEALSFLANSEDLGGLDCLEGYPDGTYRGTRALTRYEFAAGLAACLDAISGPVNADQLERIEALQREFAAELAALRGRVDALEAAVDELEANQFSTTTRLNAEAIFAAADLFGGDDQDFGENNNLFLG
ncbi:MAG: iron uptake porin, partial [Cyanobacteria bacterium J06638_20]